MDSDREASVRKAIEYCIENFDVQTATNIIVTFWKNELEANEKYHTLINKPPSF